MKRQSRNSHGDGGEERKRSKRAAAELVAVAEEEWAWLKRGVVDEQMSWGYITMPKWGVEFMAESYGDLFSDVVWDDDIWNLKTIHEMPANT
ncbi:hypothetical protein ACOSP7_019816 [Xanthoceras sorbifolium]